MSNRGGIFKAIVTGMFFLLIVSYAGAEGNDSAKTKGRGEYSFVLYGGAGREFYAATPGVPKDVETDVTKSYICGSVRLMWHPDHLLRVGIESGYIPFYSYTINDTNDAGKLSLNAVPLLLEWSMPVGKRINVFLGYGIYFLNSKLDYEGITKSSTRSIGFVAAASYVQPVTEDLGIAGEVKWMNANETKNKVLCFQVQLVWKLFKW